MAVAPFRLLFVCMGNICRSPTAHAVMRHHVHRLGLQDWLQVDSAGTHAYHLGHAPDARSQQHARKRGYEMHDLRARQVSEHDFAHHDLLLAMDWDNLALLQAQCPPELQPKVRRLAEFFRVNTGTVVPDPYYGGANGFDAVLDLVEDGCSGLLAHCLNARGLAVPPVLQGAGSA